MDGPWQRGPHIVIQTRLKTLVTIFWSALAPPWPLHTVYIYYLGHLFNNWFRIPFGEGHTRRLYGSELRTYRRGIHLFAPDGFLSRVGHQAAGNTPQHDARYIGSFPRPLLDSQGIPIRGRFLQNNLTTVIKYQFDPILENVIQPIPPFVQEVSDYLGKSTGKTHLY